MTQFEKDPPSHMAVPGSRRRSLLTGIAMGILLLLTGGAWALASPPGSSPDDNFHLPSIWCAWSPEATGCTIDPATADTSRPYASIPALQGTDVECHKFRPDVSAACQFDPDTPPGTTTVDNGLYPDGFYAVLRVLASDEAGASVVAMRMLVFTLCVGILAWAGFLLRAPDRYRVWLIWVAAALPLGVFLFASTNPSSTTIAGVTAAGTAVYAGGLADTKSRRIGSIALAILATAIALGSRAEASFFLIVAIAAGLVLHGRFWRLGRRLLLPAGASIAVTLVGLVAFGTRGAAAVGDGVGDTPDAPPRSVGSVIMELPSYFVGDYATTVGWLDTPMPSLVWASAALAIGGLIRWWDSPVPPWLVLVWGSLAFAALAVALGWRAATRQDDPPAASPRASTGRGHMPVATAALERPG